MQIKPDLTKYDGETIDHVIPQGTYVLATKYNDGDPGDAWGVGCYLESFKLGDRQRHRVLDGDGNYLYGPKGFQRMRAGLQSDVGHWLVNNADTLQRSPPGSINLWTMLTDIAFGVEPDAATGGVADQHST